MPYFIVTTIKPDKHLWGKYHPGNSKFGDQFSWVVKRENATGFKTEKEASDAAKPFNDVVKVVEI